MNRKAVIKWQYAMKTNVLAAPKKWDALVRCVRAEKLRNFTVTNAKTVQTSYTYSAMKNYVRNVY